MKDTSLLLASTYIKKIINQANKLIFHHLEYLYLSQLKQTSSPHCPVFVIGAPRSGSTLITQVITDAFSIGYLSNGHCRFFGAPILADMFLHPLHSKKPSDYTSEYGNTKQLYAPAECGEFWYRFFRRTPAHVRLCDVDKHKMAHFRRTVLALMQIHNKPALFKNLYATLRILPISTYLPEALFIITQRDEVDNAHSILQARLKQFGDYRVWWSVPPPNVEILKKLPPEQQAVEQIRQLNTLVESNICEGGLNTGRFLTIDYNEFCDNVHGQLKRIDLFFQRHGMEIKRLYRVPPIFKRVRKVSIDPELFQKLVSYSENKRISKQIDAGT